MMLCLKKNKRKDCTQTVSSTEMPSGYGYQPKYLSLLLQNNDTVTIYVIASETYSNIDLISFFLWSCFLKSSLENQGCSVRGIYL